MLVLHKGSYQLVLCRGIAFLEASRFQRRFPVRLGDVCVPFGWMGVQWVNNIFVFRWMAHYFLDVIKKQQV